MSSSSKSKVKRIRRRRLSSKKNRHERKLKLKLKNQELRLQKEMEIDQWLQWNQAEEEKYQEESEFHQEIVLAQKVLLNQIKSIKSNLDKLKLLQKIRSIYCVNKSPSTDSDNQQFQETITNLRLKLLEILNIKKNSLINLNNLHNDKSTNSRLQQLTIQELNSTDTNEALFGSPSNGPDCYSNKLINQRNIKSTDKSLSQIRSLWDSYIDNNNGSPIPSKWFYQNEPNKEWSQFVLDHHHHHHSN